VASDVPSLPSAVETIIRYQQDDGSFAVLNPIRANPYRESVLAGILALASSL
jgi:hypothetical protein